MAVFKPAIRLRVFAPRSTDPNEATVLTPTGGAHSDAFQVITHSGIAGLTGTWQPYLRFPGAGRNGQADLLKKKNKGGTHTFQILDKRTGAPNSTRWGTNFMGDASGLPQFLGLLVHAEITEDRTAGSPVWEDWFWGRIDDVEMSDLVTLDLVCGDMLQELKGKIFNNFPHDDVSTFIPPNIWPRGLESPVGIFPASVKMTGQMATASLGNGKSVLLDVSTQGSEANVVTDALRASGVSFGLNTVLAASDIHYREDVVARVTQTSGGGAGTTEEYQLGACVTMFRFTSGPGFVNYVHEIRELFVDNPGGSLPADGTTVEVTIRRPNAEADPDHSFYFTDTHPAQMIEWGLDGKLGFINPDGSVRRAFKKNASNLTAFIADTTLKPGRFYIRKTWDLVDFIEAVCQQWNLGWRQNASGEVELVDHRTPTSTAGFPTITSAQLSVGDGADLRWRLSRDNAITQFDGNFYVDELEGTESEPSIGGSGFIYPSTLRILERKRFLKAADFGRGDLGDKPHKVDFFAFRSAVGETYQNAPREDYVRGLVLEVFDQYRSPYGYGPQEMTITLRRDATTKAIREGDPYFLNADEIPNPGTNLRGGSRLVRCLSWRENGPFIIHRILDLGPGTTPASPTVSALALESGNTSHGVTVTVTLNGAGDPAEVDFAVTATSITDVVNVPDAAWTRSFFLTATKALTVRSFPAKMHVWVRVRSVPGPGSIAKLPSGYAYASGTDYILTAALTAPTGLAVGTINEKSAKLTWNAVNHPVEIHLVSPSSDTIDDSTVWKVVGPGTAEFFVSGTVASATYKADIRSIDGSGGASAFAGAVTWTATGAVPTAPTPVGLATIEVA